MAVTKDPDELFLALEADDLDGARAVIRAYVERDGNVDGATMGMLALQVAADDFGQTYRELDAYRRELSGEADPSGQPYV